MLTALKLGGFKAFAETQTIPLRPLTLIFGPNSSGKSSIIHGLLFAHEANRTGNPNVRRTQLGGDSVDLGGYEQFRHRSKTWQGDITWGAEFSLDPSTQPDSLLVPARTGRFLGRFAPTLSGGELALDGIPIFVTSEWLIGAGPEKQPPEINYRHPILRAALNSLIERHVGREIRTRARAKSIDRILERAGRDLVGHLICDEAFLPRGLAKSKTGVAGEADRFVKELKELKELPADPALREFVDAVLVSYEPPPSTGRRAQTRPRKKSALNSEVTVLWYQIVDRAIRSISDVLGSELNRLAYLGPLRSYPPRDLAYDQPHDPNWLAGGGHAYDVVRRDWAVRQDVNKWLGNKEYLSTPYELRVEYTWTIREIAEWLRGGSEDTQSALQSLDDMDFDEEMKESYPGTPPARIQVMSLTDMRTGAIVTHRDVGIGISQILPVLVHAFASKNRMIAIEQPEIHLHPALQADLADVFIESALGERKNMFILETHSEHLILRLLRRIRETTENKLPDGARPITPDQVSVIYVEPTDHGSVVSNLRIDESGEFIDRWPRDFFEERVDEIL